MLTVNFFLFYLTMLPIVYANTLSLQGASPVGYNKSFLNSTNAFSGHPIPLISSRLSPSAPASHNLSANSCCFVVQDTIDVRYWDEYVTPTTVLVTRTTLITFATQYIDTLVTTNVSTMIRTLNVTSSVTTGGPTIPNNANSLPGPSLAQIPLTSSPATLYGMTITPPTEVYVFRSVNVIQVPAVLDEFGQLKCATTSTFLGQCSDSPPQMILEGTSTVKSNLTNSAGSGTPLPITGINSNAELYFSPGQKHDFAILSSKFDMVSISFSRPFVYAPLSDPFPSKVVNENFGYVPQNLIEWMAQQPDYVSKVPGIATCLPGGPSIDFYDYYFCPSPPSAYKSIALFEFNRIATGLTASTTVTIAGRGCFHPGACPTSAAPGATAVAAMPVVTPEVPPQAVPSPNSPPPQALAAPEKTQSSTPASSPQNQAPKPSPSAPIDSSEIHSAGSPEGNHEAESPPNKPAASSSKVPGIAALIASAFGLGPTSPSKSEDVKPSPGPTPIRIYSVSIAPSASAVVINGITSIPLALGYDKSVAPGALPIAAVGSEEITQNAASQYVVGGQTLTPGAPAIRVQGTEVSLAPSASVIVIAGSTIALSSTNAPAFTVGSKIVTANSASQYVVDGQTLTPGGPAVTVSGTRVSLAPSGTQVIVGSNTIELAPSITRPPPPPSPLTFDSQTFEANAAGAYVIAGKTLVPGGSAITVSGTPISLALAASQVVIGSSTSDLSPVITPPPLTFGSQTYTADINSKYTIAGQTLTPGGPPITVSGTRLSLAPSATQVIIGSSTENLASATTLPPLTFGSQTFTANSASDYIIDGQTLAPGGQAITVSGTRLSLAPSATQIVIGSSTIPLNPTAPSSHLPSLTIGSQTITPNAAGAYVIAGQTLTPGAAGIVVPASLIGSEAAAATQSSGSAASDSSSNSSSSAAGSGSPAAFTGNASPALMNRLSYSLMWFFLLALFGLMFVC